MNPDKILMLAVLLAATSLPALAEDGGVTQPGAPGQVQPADNGRVTAHHGSVTFLPNGGGFFKMNTVRDAPYSAQAISERQQNLGDGNQISQRRDSATWYRDSAGRTRLEVRDKDGELVTATINDPVAGAAWTLDPRKRTAFKVTVRGRTADEARQPGADGGAAQSDNVIVKRIERTDGHGHVPREVRIRAPQAITPDGTPLGQALASLGDARWKKNTVTKDLGTKTFDGVKAEGKLRTYEIPAGDIGNRNPIVVADETWYAPELQITVYTKHSDPRSGDSVFRLENLKREEPAAALFGVPADYAVKDLPGRQKWAK